MQKNKLKRSSISFFYNYYYLNIYLKAHTIHTLSGYIYI